MPWIAAQSRGVQGWPWRAATVPITWFQAAALSTSVSSRSKAVAANIRPSP
ncbi:hypothetical protein [Amycolatopsis sp. Hca4]|uniref:hypothetical protein n=1 Tax=Amycolatopsis sp. Hca4 TaxID=2742131 RepID=UPI0015905AFA|nr:hypothetical protein [Amycolatopsis sp. Hca4]QKV80267.1 hypothetical protein HUT10_45600 [Amycolatopsis sp. Hca4]